MIQCSVIGIRFSFSFAGHLIILLETASEVCAGCRNARLGSAYARFRMDRIVKQPAINMKRPTKEEVELYKRRISLAS